MHAEIVNRSWSNTYVYDVDTRRNNAIFECSLEPFGAGADIATKGNAPAILARHVAAETAPEQMRHIIVEIAVGYATDIIFTEDVRVHVGILRRVGRLVMLEITHTGRLVQACGAGTYLPSMTC